MSEENMHDTTAVWSKEYTDWAKGYTAAFMAEDYIKKLELKCEWAKLMDRSAVVLSLKDAQGVLSCVEELKAGKEQG